MRAPGAVHAAGSSWRVVAWSAAVVLAWPATALAAVLEVGASRALRVPSEAAAVARDGDTVAIDPGTYAGDVAVWHQSRLVLRAAGGAVHLRADGRAAQGKAIWVIRGDDVSVEGIEFSGAAVPDRNGAGIRHEGAGLRVDRCHFHDNETGILTTHVARSRVLVEHSRFERNGHPDGQAHNLYIGRIASFTLRFSVVSEARIGSNVKSRARRNDIRYNIITDGDTASVNYAIDLSSGGHAEIVGNVIRQNAATGNYHMIAFAPEGTIYAENALLVAHNTMINERRWGRFVWNHAPGTAVVLNNVFAGPGRVVRGHALVRGNLRVVPTLSSTSTSRLGGVADSGGNRLAASAGFRDAPAGDYRIDPGSPAEDLGVEPGALGHPGLAARFEWTPGDDWQPRVTRGHAPDAGAFEATGPGG